ncbi:hypothetical protein R3P38DRAFT_2773242 [Favolaschia claudopus]|uniref:Uncharacterized protein n=1 Tax=Favolaschia claudopus TaxID=2862362 RepID=A0AAW0C0J5_9AGAR
MGERWRGLEAEAARLVQVEVGELSASASGRGEGGVGWSRLRVGGDGARKRRRYPPTASRGGRVFVAGRAGGGTGEWVIISVAELLQVARRRARARTWMGKSEFGGVGGGVASYGIHLLRSSYAGCGEFWEIAATQSPLRIIVDGSRGVRIVRTLAEDGAAGDEGSHKIVEVVEAGEGEVERKRRGRWWSGARENKQAITSRVREMTPKNSDNDLGWYSQMNLKRFGSTYGHPEGERPSHAPEPEHYEASSPARSPREPSSPEDWPFAPEVSSPARAPRFAYDYSSPARAPEPEHYEASSPARAPEPAHHEAELLSRVTDAEEERNKLRVELDVIKKELEHTKTRLANAQFNADQWKQAAINMSAAAQMAQKVVKEAAEKEFEKVKEVLDKMPFVKQLNSDAYFS